MKKDRIKIYKVEEPQKNQNQNIKKIYPKKKLNPFKNKKML